MGKDEKNYKIALRRCFKKMRKSGFKKNNEREWKKERDCS